MLELPEIETLRRDLEREAVGKKIKTVEVSALKVVPNLRTKKAVSEALEGTKVTLVERHGLAMVLTLDNEHALVLQLGEDGRLQRCASKAKSDPETVVNLTFTQGGDLRVLDSKALTGKASARMDIVPLEELAQLIGTPESRGLDLLVRPIAWIEFGAYILRRTEPLKVLLTDQSVFVGIGAIYSDEILFDAGIRYDRPASGLSMQEVRRLYRSVVGILHDAIKYRGTSLPERPFLDLAGKPGEYAEHLAVYGKEGQLSQRSRDPILKATFRGMTVFYCPTQV